MRSLLIVFIFASLSLGYAHAQTKVRLASWNISNFTHLENVEHRPGIGTKRSPADFEVLRRYAQQLQADVIALQEIGTVEAAEMLFPPSEYLVLPSEHLVEASSAGKTEEISTAIAVRKRPDISVLEQDDLNELAVVHAADKRRVRSGADALLEIAGTKLWIMSVHLKSSCPDVKALSASRDADCITFWSQRVPLRNWIAEREESAEAFAIMGDFNRQFRRYGLEDEFWQALSPDGASALKLVAHPQSVTRLCPTRLGSSTQPID